MHTALALCLFLAPVAALRVPGPLSPRNANYRIEASLDAAKKSVQGHAHLTWRNPATVEARELVFHLYMNAFRNEASIFFKESHGRHRGNAAGAHGWGAIDVSKITVGGADVTRRLRVDDTLGRLPLDTPVAPGGVIEIDLEFTTRLPRVYARTGWAEDFFAVAQWFPKIAVWDGAWHADQLHLNSEFFADFGVYDVQVDVPQGWPVGATGVQTRTWTENARTFVLFHAEDVTDFAWFTGPRFIERTARHSEGDGELELRLLVWPGHEALAQRHLDAAEHALTTLEQRYGAYPYSLLTIVDVPDDAEGAGGMEYPTLFTTVTFPVPGGVHLLEWVTAHELAHQFFQGIVSSDEAEEAWLDEGLTETMTDFCLSAQFGREGSLYDFLGHRLAYSDASRLGYRRVAGIDPPETPSFDFLDNATYGAVTYSKTDLILRTMEGLIGDLPFRAGMRRYFEAGRFHHPRLADFVSAFDEGAGQDRSRLWHDLLQTERVLDYQLLRVSADRIKPIAGLVRSDGGVETEVSPAPDSENDRWRSEVVVHRKGTLALPVAVRVVFDDGSEKRERWDDDGSGPTWRRFVYETAKPVAYAELDPDHLLTLELTRLDDGRRRQPDAGPRRQILGGWQRWLSLALSAVGF